MGLDALDKRIDSLEARIDKEWDKMDQATRERSRAALKALRKKRNEVAEWYGAMKNSSSAAWEQIKKGFVNAYEALVVAWEKTEKEFNSSK